jgi:acyl carrier protein
MNKLREILVVTFPNSAVPDDIGKLQLNDLPDWDSIGNFNLLLAVEQEFGMQFSMTQIEKIKSVAEIIEVLSNDASS